MAHLIGETVIKLPKGCYIQLAVMTMAAIFSISTSASDVDSIREPHLLRPLEVVGVKQSPEAMEAEAVSRITGAETRRLGIESTHNLGEIVPNLYMPAYGTRMTSSIYVRGLGARIDQPVIGLTVDNVSLLNKDAYDFDIPDIETVEVLRGAQSVINGRNTMGGQINIRTLSPFDTKGLRMNVGYGNGNTVTAGASYYGKLSDSLGMSIGASYRHTDGFFKNAYDGEKLDDENSGSVRWKTQWRPSPAFSICNTAAVAIAKQGGYPYEHMVSGTISYNDTCSYRRTLLTDGLSVAWAGKRVVVTSLTSFQYLDDDMHLDQDFLPEAYFTLEQKRKECALTQDLFTRGSRGAYSWLGGVFAFYKNADMSAPVTFKDVGIAQLIESYRNDINPEYPIGWDSRIFTLGSDFDLRSYGVAAYHRSSYLIGKWRFVVGLRLDYEHAALDYISSCNTGYTTYHIESDGTREIYSHTPILINDGEELSMNFLELLPQVTIAREDDAFTPYFNFSKGYKAGGYNTQMFSDVLKQRIMRTMGIASTYSLKQIVQYEPERSYNYELGFHSKFDNFKIDAVAFYIDCRNQQLTTFPAGTTTGRVMTNAGRTRSLGVELSLRWNPNDDLQMQMAYGYTNAKFRRYNDGTADYRGKYVPYAPANTFFANAVYRLSQLQFCSITPSVGVTVNGAGRIFWNEANTLRQDFYACLGSDINFTSRLWNLRLWARNITSTDYYTFYFKSMGNSFVQRALPCTFGATLRLHID